MASVAVISIEPVTVRFMILADLVWAKNPIPFEVFTAEIFMSLIVLLLPFHVPAKGSVLLPIGSQSSPSREISASSLKYFPAKSLPASFES